MCNNQHVSQVQKVAYKESSVQKKAERCQGWKNGLAVEFLSDLHQLDKILREHPLRSDQPASVKVLLPNLGQNVLVAQLHKMFYALRMLEVNTPHSLKQSYRESSKQF